MTYATPAESAERGNSRGQHTRQRLLTAALRSFASQGFHGTGTRDIAELAGMSPAAVYAHYGTKEMLLFELSLAGHREIQIVVADASGHSDNPVEQLRTVVAEYTAWHARAHTTARVVQYEMAALTPEHAAEIARIRRDIEERFRRIIRRGMESGSFRVTDLAMVALAILSLGVDVARWYREDGTWTPGEIGAQYGGLALRMVGYAGG
jgi:AcrR family transcriptional regulator